MEVLKLNLVCSLIFLILSIQRTNVGSAATVFKVQKVELLPTAAPNQVKNIFLFGMNLASRQDLCKRMLSEIKEPILSLDEYSYVPTAHQYEFVDYSQIRKELPAIKCPTTPTLYLSHEDEHNSSSWSVRIWAPIGGYEFNFEVAEDVREEVYNSVTDKLLNRLLIAEDHHLRSKTGEERWWLCVNAQKLIRYKIQWRNNITDLLGITTYTYIYDQRITFNVAYECPTNPKIFIRIDPTKDEPHISKRDQVVITLLRKDGLRNELNLEK